MNIFFLFLILIGCNSSFCMEGKSSKRSSLEPQMRKFEMQELTQVVVESQSDSNVSSPFVKTSYENSFTEESEDEFHEDMEFPVCEERSKALKKFREQFSRKMKNPKWDVLFDFLMTENDGLFLDLTKQIKSKENVPSRDADNSTYIFLNRKFAEGKTEMVDAVKEGMKEEYKNIESQIDEVKSLSNRNRNIIIATNVLMAIFTLGGLASFIHFGNYLK
ncbi:hypothetical protein M1446_04375 [Candidatus Dependentiae bacterium]|nr:hypothetical protein [Candidatus Dependentiae bacterium]